MKRLLVSCVVSLVFCLSASVYAADINFGNGQVIATLAAAIAAGSNGDDFYFHGQTETNQTVDFNLNNCTFQAGDGADYILDGQLGTQDGLTISGTGNTFDFGGQFKLTGYGRYVLYVTGASNVISDAYVYDNGYNYGASPYCYHISLLANSDLIRPVIASGLDQASRHYGLSLNNCGSGSVTDATIQGITVTGASSRIYGVVLNSSNGNILVDGALLSGLSAQTIYAILFAGGSSSDVGRIRRLVASGLTAVGTIYGVSNYDCGMDLEDFVISGTAGATVYDVASLTPTGYDAGANNRIVNGTIYNSAGTGVWSLNTSAGSQLTARNVVVSGSTANGFLKTGTIAPDSDYNVAYNNGTDYSGWATGANDWTGIDPLFADPTNGDLYLLPESPCIDAGTWITGRTKDTAGQPISGPAMDRGTYEFQQTGTRDKRAYLYQDVPRPSRQVRHR